LTEKAHPEEQTMHKKIGAIAIKSLALLVVFGKSNQAMAQDATTRYPNMATIDQYLISYI
jgi:hypothetical protein